MANDYPLTKKENKYILSETKINETEEKKNLWVNVSTLGFFQSPLVGSSQITNLMKP